MGGDGTGRNSSSALVRAVRGRKLAAARMLLANEAGVNTADANGITPLIHAARDGLYDFVTLLLGWGANKEDTYAGDTPLFWALKGGFYNNVVQLLSAGANKEAVDPDGYTPLYYSAKNGLMPFLTLFILNGCVVDATDTSEDYPLDPWGNDPAGSEPTDYLMADPRGRSFFDETPVTVLYHAVRHGQPLVIQALLDAGANVEVVDSVGLTPFWYAALAGHQTIMDKLIAKGANKEIKDLHDFTPLAMAATYNRKATVTYLLGKGASKVGLLTKPVLNYLGYKYWEWDYEAPGWMGSAALQTSCPQRQDGGCPWRDSPATQVWTLQSLLHWRGFSNMVTLLT